MPSIDKTANTLELVDVSKAFGGVAAVAEVSVGFDPGAVTCVIGPNGAGKTTLYNLITGALQPDTGEIRLGSRLLNGLPLHRIARLGIGRLFQDVRVFNRMTALENVCIGRKGQPGENIFAAPLWPLIGGRSERTNCEQAREHLSFVGLTDFADRPAEELSYGQQKLVAIARLLNNGASCLLLDEPTAGINPTMAENLLDVIRRLADESHTVVVIEHNLDVVGRVGDWVYLMERGRIEAFGTPAEILREAALARLMPEG